MFAKIENNVVLEWPVPSITARFPNTSFPEVLTVSALPEGYVRVKASAPPSTAANQKAVPSTPVKENNQWVQGWKIVELSQQETEERNKLLANSIRIQRDKLLSDTDWVVTKAYENQRPVPLEWVKYRQALRDIPMQVGFPTQVDWPTQPI